MEDNYSNPSKLVAKGKIKALFSDEGEVLYLDIDGSIYEGVGDTVPVPLWRLRRLRLGDIPPNVFIEPVEKIQENIVYSLRYSSRLFFNVRMSNKTLKIELNDWAQTWESFIGFYAYIEALTSTLEEAEEAGFIKDLYEDFSDDSFYVSFNIEIPEDFTVLKTVKLARRLLQQIEREVEYRAALLAYRESKRILRRLKRNGRREGIINSLDRIYGRYNL